MAAARPEPAPLRKIGNLMMIWRRAIRYPGKIAAAGFFLLITAGATLAIPDGFRRVIDQGFSGRGGDISHHFYYLLGMVVRRNPTRASVETYRDRIATKRYAQRWPRVTVVPA